MEMYWLSDMCCACLTTNEKLIDMQEADDTGVTYIKQLITLIPEYMTPVYCNKKLICCKCLTNLTLALEFRNMCLKSSTSLNEYVKLLTKNDFLPNSRCNIQVDLYRTDIIKHENERDTDLCKFAPSDLPTEHKTDMKSEDMFSLVKKEEIEIEEECLFVINTDSLDVTDTSQQLQIENGYRSTTPTVKMEIFDEFRHAYETSFSLSCSQLIEEQDTISKLEVTSETASPVVVEEIRPVINDNCVKCTEISEIHRTGEDHMLIHTGETTDLCKTEKGSLKRPIATHTGESPYKCDVCKKQFKRNSHLKRHMLIHTGEKPYKCDLCRKQFITNDNLKNHMLIHTGEKPYKCDLCNKQFNNSSTLRKHVFIHTGEKPYKCDLCNKRFNNNGILRKHVLIHTGEKPYKCDLCRKQFSLRSHLKSHILVHTEEKPYKCDFCNKKYTQRIGLKTHMSIHTGEKPYKCKLCNKHFIRRSNLKEHMLIHTGENPYKCDVCKKQFNWNSDLKRHMLIHTGEKPYKCDLCNKQFKKSCTLKSHMLIHTGEKP